MPGYDGPTWVRLHAYQKRDWQELIGRGRRSIDSCWLRRRRCPVQRGRDTCTVGGSAPLTLQFVLEDYIHHMKDHLGT